MTDKTKIAIITTVSNFELYQKTSQSFPKSIKKYVIDGRNGMHGIDSIRYMMKKLRKRGIEWLIMADEDVIFTKEDKAFKIIDDMQKQSIVACGVRDGGMIPHRTQNPWTANTFFSILNFKEVEAIWNEKEVLKNQYVLEDEFDDDLSSLINDFDTKSLYEPYYCFYFWLRRKNKKILFLDAKIYDDEISNSILYKNEIFLYHTWYARSYGVNEKHTKRIDYILDSLDIDCKENTISEFTVFDKKIFILEKSMIKLFKKIKKKLS